MIENLGKNNTLAISDSVLLHKSKLTILGDNNSIEICDGAKIKSSNIRLKGNNIRLYIGENVELTGVVASAFANCIFSVGKNTTIGNGEFTIAEEKSIVLGEDCMLAHGYDIRTSDMHPIYDQNTGKRLNYGASINIGNHVWLGRNVAILKGVTIADNVVIGINSVVSKSISESHSVATGYPARVIRHGGVVWGRKMYHKTMYDDPTISEYYRANSFD